MTSLFPDTLTCCVCSDERKAYDKLSQPKAGQSMLGVNQTIYRKGPDGRQLVAVRRSVHVCEPCMVRISVSRDKIKAQLLGAALVSRLVERYNALCEVR